MSENKLPQPPELNQSIPPVVESNVRSVTEHPRRNQFSVAFWVILVVIVIIFFGLVVNLNSFGGY